MNARAFREWIGRLALLAALLLAAVPTAGRLSHAASAAAHDPVARPAPQAGHHAHAVADADADAVAPCAPRAAPDDAHCDYCPLLSSLLAATRFASTPAALLRPSSRISSLAAPRLPWLHPSGLGSRGPPRLG